MSGAGSDLNVKLPVEFVSLLTDTLMMYSRSERHPREWFCGLVNLSVIYQFPPLTYLYLVVLRTDCPCLDIALVLSGDTRLCSSLAVDTDLSLCDEGGGS